MENEDFLYQLRLAVQGDNDILAQILALLRTNAVSQAAVQETLIYLRNERLPAAVYIRGLLYKEGLGVSQDYDQSFLLMRDAAAKGHPYATYEVGHHFMHGLGVEKSYEDAHAWLIMAAGSPHYIPQAMYDLGIIYEQGLGRPVNMSLAESWFQKAHEKNYLPAKEKLYPEE